MSMRLVLACAAALVSFCACVHAQSPPREKPPATCGLDPSDWCPSPAGDRCGEHHDEDACRADARCEGMPYRGESLVACKPDGKGFWSNCPAVGCVTRSKSHAD